MGKHLVKIALITAFIALSLAMIFVITTLKKQPNIPTLASSLTSPSPSPAGTSEKTVNTETIEAPDGKLILIVREEKVDSGLKKTLTIQNLTGERTEIYSKTVPAGNVLSIPYNAFSPDNKYIFLKESTSTDTLYYVLATSGNPLTSDSAELEVTGNFYSKYTDFIITDVTGWGGINLLVVNTDNKSGGQGPSFWYELPGGGIIRLSNRFN